MPLPLLFCHGLESAPIGRKSQGLIDLGCDVTAPDCRNKNLAERIALIAAAITAAPELPVVVGSSFGGIAGLVATIVAAQQGKTVPGLVLCAPALQLPPPAPFAASLTAGLRPPCPTTIVHGMHDDIIAIDISRAFAEEHDLLLVEVDDDHHLGVAGFEAIVAAVVESAGRPPNVES